MSAVPYLRDIRTIPERLEPDKFPFTIPAFRGGVNLSLTTAVTFIVGENGAGKSTLLEAIAEKSGFNISGGSRNHTYGSDVPRSPLAGALRLSWAKKPMRGFFLRAESFFNFASYIDEVGAEDAYGGKSLHAQSHGESFMSLFNNRFNGGFYVLDEPEAALSPQRQLAFLTMLHDFESEGQCQFLISTHSPILFSYPGATVVAIDEHGFREVDYRETEHFLVTKRFLDSPERFFRHLFA